MNPSTASAEAIDALLPQTQCRQCGFAGCRPYADAIASGSAEINQCPPGGDEVIAELAGLLAKTRLPLNPGNGVIAAPAVAIIDEPACIGCTLCITACPVDAIVGARKLMHTVVTADCTGCGLCIPPCPVDCITLRPTGNSRDREQQRSAAPRLRDRYRAHQTRDAAREQLRRERAAKAAATRKKAIIDKALARAKERLSGRRD